MKRIASLPQIFSYSIILCLGTGAYGVPTSSDKLPAPLSLKIETTLGNLQCDLDVETSEQGVNHFRTLISQEVYLDSTICRVVPSYFIQGGCPATAPNRAPEKTVELTPVGEHSVAGILSLVPHESGQFGQQFVILERPAPWLDKTYLPIGRCRPIKTIKTIARVPTLAKARPRRSIRITSIKVDLDTDTKSVNGLAK